MFQLFMTVFIRTAVNGDISRRFFLKPPWYAGWFRKWLHIMMVHKGIAIICPFMWQQIFTKPPWNVWLSMASLTFHGVVKLSWNVPDLSRRCHKWRLLNRYRLSIMAVVNYHWILIYCNDWLLSKPTRQGLQQQWGCFWLAFISELQVSHLLCKHLLKHSVTGWARSCHELILHQARGGNKDFLQLYRKTWWQRRRVEVFAWRHRPCLRSKPGAICL